MPMPTSNKKILVTGADGFIGSHLTEHLVRAGYDVRAFVLYNSFNAWGWLDRASAEIRDALDVFAGDVRDPNGVRQAVQGCDIVLHLAALIAIPYSYHSPDTYVDTNIKGTLHVVQAARESGARVVHTSTSEVYGTARTVPIARCRIRRRARYTAPRERCRSPRIIRCKRSRPTPHQRSVPIRSRCRSITRSARRSRSCVRSIPMGRVSPHAP